ncbi:serine protease 30 [Ixodes scapularis]|uniref:serine protease 30 n=1 Tax=Ixodes scapularis TaxID=6945 RepID=UPI001161ABE5|nr:serine protease 30 [Ixodes scapularis]
MLRESSWWPVLLLTACLHLADPQIHLYIPAHRETDSESGYSNRQGSCSYGGDDRCTFVLLCLLSGGTSAGRCGNSLLYTCCLRPSTRSSLPADHAPAAQLVHARSPPAASSSSASSSAAARATQRKYYPVDEDDICGRSTNKPQRRIIGGEDAQYGEFPWQAHIKISRQQCGGALVNHFYVVTAAHCVHHTPLRRISVILGAYDIQDQRYQLSQAQAYSVVEKKIHPNFAFSASQPDRFDVALLRLDRHVRYQENILPICLPPRGWTFEGWRASVTGWGKTDSTLSNRYGTRVLQKVEVPIITRSECEHWHHIRGIRIRIHQEMMCAGYKEGRRDACVGDSGGPMMLNLHGRWTLVGITSAGFGCAQSFQPGIYHQVSMSVDWILANMR